MERPGSARSTALAAAGMSATFGAAASSNGAFTARSDRAEWQEARGNKPADLLAAEAQFFATQEVKEAVQSARHHYPRKAPAPGSSKWAPLPMEEEDTIPRRIMGFGLGFEKIFATTSIKLPVSAYTLFVELHPLDKQEVFSRCFNGLHTVFDLKKWVYEKLLVPLNSYELSYAEASKACLTDQLRLLTTQDSLDTRTLATTRAVHRFYKGIPGVHSIDDIGVTRLYVRLKCRTCGDLLNSLQTCLKMKSFGHIEPTPEKTLAMESAGDAGGPTLHSSMTHSGCPSASERIPGADPNIEDCWYKPDDRKHCLFHTRGFEMWQAGRAHGESSEVARIYISMGKEPSKKLKLANNVLHRGGGGFASKKISY